MVSPGVAIAAMAIGGSTRLVWWKTASFPYLLVSGSAGQGALVLLCVARCVWASYRAVAATFHETKSGSCKISYGQKLHSVTSSTFY